MAYLFVITSNTAAVKLDIMGRGTVQYTVKNVSGAPIDGRAVLVSPPVASASGAVQSGWVKIDGATDRHFEKDKEEVYTVKIQIPQTPKRPEPGTYSFRLDEVSVEKPDQGDQGPSVSLELAAPIVNHGTKRWQVALIVAAILLVFVGGGLGLWYGLTRDKVPDLRGESVQEATDSLKKVNMTLDNNKIQFVSSEPGNYNKIVGQTPAPNTKATKNGMVEVTVGQAPVQVPSLTALRMEDAIKLLRDNGLNPGEVNYESNNVYVGGIVFQQTPHAGEWVSGESVVNLTVTPKTVLVPQVINESVAQAVQTLQARGLAIGSVAGDEYAKLIIAQNPQNGTQVAVGSKVNVTIPSSPKCNPLAKCIVPVFIYRLKANQKFHPQP